ncbi:MAG: hypothetical protein FWE17_02540 [Alphaproteobacteria bacterium]|nr:hypothetical protein [Alphaproteobacteria bacterium]MCL2758475.1 hypothetical protein [Alphaproteobacteria bacterium]
MKSEDNTHIYPNRESAVAAAAPHGSLVILMTDDEAEKFTKEFETEHPEFVPLMKELVNEFLKPSNQK